MNEKKHKKRISELIIALDLITTRLARDLKKNDNQLTRKQALAADVLCAIIGFYEKNHHMFSIRYAFGDAFVMVALKDYFTRGKYNTVVDVEEHPQFKDLHIDTIIDFINETLLQAYCFKPITFKEFQKYYNEDLKIREKARKHGF